MHDKIISHQTQGRQTSRKYFLINDRNLMTVQKDEECKDFCGHPL